MGHAPYGAGYSSAGVGPSRAPRLTWEPAPTVQGPELEYSFDPPAREPYGGYARGDVPPSPDRGEWPVPVWEPSIWLDPRCWVGRSSRVARGRYVVCSCVESPGVRGFSAEFHSERGRGFFPPYEVCMCTLH